MSESMERIGMLTADLAAARKLSFAALAAYYRRALDEARSEVRSALATVAGTVKKRQAAAACKFSQAAVHQWSAEAPLSDARVMAAVRRRLGPFLPALDELAVPDAEIAELPAQIAALQEIIRLDPQTPFVPWLDRTSFLYDRVAWHRGRLVPVRNPIRQGLGGWYRIETVDYSDILDRKAQQTGEDIDRFTERLEQVRRQRSTVQHISRLCCELAVRRVGLRRTLNRAMGRMAQPPHPGSTSGSTPVALFAAQRRRAHPKANMPQQENEPMPDHSASICPRCLGRMFPQRSIDGPTTICIACGFTRETPRTPKEPPSSDPSRHPAHGKGKRRIEL